MKVAIMQPTYLPWSGYFNMIHQADLFIFLDDVQFAKRSWQQRNRIMLSGSEHFLSVPVQCKGKREQLIWEVLVDDSQQWREKHVNTLAHAYRKHPFGAEAIAPVTDALAGCGAGLAELNITIISAFCSRFGITTPFRRSSDLAVHGKKSEHLLALCREVGATTYLSARGSREYIEEEQVFSGTTVDVAYHDYHPSPYPQRGAAEFVPYLSIVDVVANLGFGPAGKLVRGAADALSA
ncbi:WbqC family protein [Geomesophilobacter sediminis]|uniref:WbqC family protein n=1 Tax=Geomesophilobacter sediminis TaxID=2798584 RepID=A0A8J7JC36_9BACT|nr:WbqC family protein [Geomesophilobacter sediminis]MBJ6724836.1 WbqC family protein [Geomesophilobacter sediminis]